MNLLSSRTGRKLLFGALYLSEGAPIGFIWWALPTRLRVAGVSVEEITALTSLLVLPWVFKFLWAPLVDTLRSHRWTICSWIITTQVLMGMSLLPLLWLDLHNNFALVIPLLVLHAFAAATQDASIDALSIASVPSDERGAVNGWMQAGMLTGRALFGGGALLVATTIGEQGVILLLAAVIWSSMVLVILTKSENKDEINRGVSVSHRWRDFFLNLGAASKQQTTWLGLLFAFISAAGFEAVGAVAGPYMIDKGLTQQDVGLFFGVAGVGGMLGGALVGGYISDKIGRQQLVATFLLLFVVNIVAIALLDGVMIHETRVGIVLLLSMLYVFIGMFTAASYALFMDITDPHLGATQFSAYMGATNGCESWAAAAVGKLHSAFGYPIAFMVMAVVSLCSLPALPRLRERKTGGGRETTEVANPADIQ